MDFRPIDLGDRLRTHNFLRKENADERHSSHMGT